MRNLILTLGLVLALTTCLFAWPGGPWESNKYIDLDVEVRDNHVMTFVNAAGDTVKIWASYILFTDGTDTTWISKDSLYVTTVVADTTIVQYIFGQVVVELDTLNTYSDAAISVLDTVYIYPDGAYSWDHDPEFAVEGIVEFDSRLYGDDGATFAGDVLLDAASRDIGDITNYVDSLFVQTLKGPGNIVQIAGSDTLDVDYVGLSDQNVEMTADTVWMSDRVAFPNDANENGIVFGDLGTATTGIDWTGSGLSGTDKFIEISGAIYWTSSVLRMSNTNIASGAVYDSGGSNLSFYTAGAGNLIHGLNSASANLHGNKTPIGSDTDATSKASSDTLVAAGHGLSLEAGMLLHVTDSGTAADEGFYQVVTVLGTDSLTVDRNFSATETDVDFTVYEDIVGFFTDADGNIRITGYQSDDEPLQIGGLTHVGAGTHSLGAEDVLIAGSKLEIKSAMYCDGLVEFASYSVHNNDIQARFGDQSDVRMIYETADPNANEFILCLPEGDATNVPVFVVGDASINNANLGLFDGIEEPRIEVVDDAATSHVGFGFLSAGVPAILTDGDMFVLAENEFAFGDTAAGDVDVSFYFAKDGAWTDEYLRWDDGDDRFKLSDDFEVTGVFILGGGLTITGDIVASAGGTYDLGSATSDWDSVFVDDIDIDVNALIHGTLAVDGNATLGDDGTADTHTIKGTVAFDSTGANRTIDLSAEDDASNSKYWMHMGGNNYWRRDGLFMADYIQSGNYVKAPTHSAVTGLNIVAGGGYDITLDVDAANEEVRSGDTETAGEYHSTDQYGDIITQSLWPDSDNDEYVGTDSLRYANIYANAMTVGDSTTGDHDGYIYVPDDGDVTADKFGIDDALGAFNVTAPIYVDGAQLDSDDLSDVASIAMLNEAEAVTAEYDFQDGLKVTAGDTLLVVDATGADSTRLYDNGTNFVVSSDNPVDCTGGFTAATLTSDGDITATDDVSADTVFAAAFVGASDFGLGNPNENIAINADSLTGAVAIRDAWDFSASPIPDAGIANDISLTNITQITTRPITSLTMTNWKLIYSADGAVPVELILGADGTFLESNGAAAAPAFRALLAADIPDISATYEVQLNNEAGLYAVLSDVTDFLQAADIDGTGELAGITDYETGSGALVFATSPALVTPTLGVAGATSVTVSDDVAQAFKAEYDIDEQLGAWVHGVKVELTRTANIQPATGGWYGGQFVLNAGSDGGYALLDKPSYALQAVYKGSRADPDNIDVNIARFETQSSAAVRDMVYILANTGTTVGSSMLYMPTHVNVPVGININMQSASTMGTGINFVNEALSTLTTGIDLSTDIDGTLTTGMKIGSCDDGIIFDGTIANYALDMNGATIGTADIRLQGGDTIDNSTAGLVVFNNNVSADSVFADHIGGNSDFTIGVTGEDVTINADSLKGAPTWHGDLDYTGTLKVDGTQVTSAVLSNDSNLPKLDANQTFTGKNTHTDSTWFEGYVGLPTVTQMDAEHIDADTAEVAVLVPDYETVTCSSDTGDVSLAVTTTFFVTDGGDDDNMDNVGMGDGVAGQLKFLAFKTNTDGGDTLQVHLNLSGGASIVFESIEDGVTLLFDGTNWNLAGSTPGIGIP